MAASRLAASVLAVWGVLAAPAWADGTVRGGDHPGFGRLVFEFTGAVGWHVERQGDHVAIAFADPGAVAALPRPPHNIRQYAASPGAVALDVAPGAVLRQLRLGPRLVLDVLDPAATRAQPVPPATMPPAPPAPAPTASTSTAPTPTVPALAVVHAETLPVEPQALAPAPSNGPDAAVPPSSPAPLPPPVLPNLALPNLALAASLVPPPAGAEAAALLPLGHAVGAAAWRRGDVGMVVFDARKPIDLASLHDDRLLGGAVVTLLPDATLLSLRLAPGMGVRLQPAPEGWIVAVGPDQASAPVSLGAVDGAWRLGLSGPGRALAVPDPLGGGNLLVGTQLPWPAAGQGHDQRHAPQGQGVAADRRVPGFTLLRTMLGVAVEPFSDHLELRGAADGFRLVSEGTSLPLPGAAADLPNLLAAATLTRLADVPDLPVDELRRRLDNATGSTAAAPPRDRFGPRLAQAQAMIALGMGAEASSLLRLAESDEPSRADDPELLGLLGMADLLAGRDAAAALADPRLDGTDEIALWRAAATAGRQEGDATAAALFATTMPLLLSYPAGLRDRLLPLAVETMVLGGEPAAAEAVLAARKDDPALQFARGLAAEQAHDVDGALAIYDALDAGRDRRLHARAASRAAELRLAAGRLDARGAADALERVMFGWRGDQREIDLRLRVADLRQAAHQWKPALVLLRETLSLFPEQAAILRARLAGALASMLEDREHGPDAVDLVAILDENADLVPDGDERVATTLADRLVALDLPKRAEPVLERLMRAAQDGVARARFGGSLAAVRLADGDGAGALAALADSDADSLPPDLVEDRAILGARSQAMQGAPGPAAQSLRGLTSERGLRLRAELAEAAKDWPEATAALASLAARNVPQDGALDDAAQDVLLRLAGNAALAGDTARLAMLAPEQRLAGKRADLFRLLTAAPVAMPADLPRVTREIALARQLPTLLGDNTAR